MWQDPEAAQAVFRSGADILAAGLDVTMDPETCLDGQHLEQIRSSSTKSARLIAQLVEYDIEHHGLCWMHDPLALAALLDASLFEFVSAQVEVVGGSGWDRGTTRAVPRGSSQSVQIASAIYGARFLELFLSRILED
jgi:purine nucleosidase